MRSPFLWWCKCKYRRLVTAFKRDPMLLLCSIAVPAVVIFMFYISMTGGLIARVG